MQVSEFFNQENQKGLFTFYKQQHELDKNSSKHGTQKNSKSIKQKYKEYLSNQSSQTRSIDEKTILKKEGLTQKAKIKRCIDGIKRKVKKPSIKSQQIEQMEKLQTIIEQSQNFDTIANKDDDSTKKFLLHIVQRNVSNMSHQTDKQFKRYEENNRTHSQEQQIQRILKKKQPKNLNYLQNSCQQMIFKKLGENKKQNLIKANKVLLKFFQILPDNHKPNLRYSKRQNMSALRSVTQPMRAQPYLYQFDQNTISQNTSKNIIPSKCQIKLPSIHRFQKRLKKSSSKKVNSVLKRSCQQVLKNQVMRKASSSKIIKSFHQQKYQKQRQKVESSLEKISTINITENCIFRKSSFGWMQKKKELAKKWGIKL